MTKNDKIIKNTSKAGSGSYAYNYASLADIAEQGHAIPEMRVKTVFTPDGTTYVGDWIEYKDGDGNWNLGSRIIDAELKGMNPMQSRGSAETYARRYTTLMALQLAGQDDKQVENEGVQRKSQAKQSGGFRVDFQTIREHADMIDDEESLKLYYEELKKKNPSANQMNAINKIISEAKARIKGEKK